MSKRAYKYRFYPTDEQKNILAQTFGCVRFLYNVGLHARSVAYKEQGKTLNYHDLAARLPALKEEFPWLKEVSSVTLQQSLRHLETAFITFFAGRAGYPTFKKRQNAQSATNAACNILAAGLSVAACGGSGRPVRAKARRATAYEAGTSHS